MTESVIRKSIAKIIGRPWLFVRIRSLAMFLGLETPISLKDIIRRCNEPFELLRHRTAFLEIDMMQGNGFSPGSAII